jgi:hypothetical protein
MPRLAKMVWRLGLVCGALGLPSKAFGTSTTATGEYSLTNIDMDCRITATFATIVWFAAASLVFGALLAWVARPGRSSLRRVLMSFAVLLASLLGTNVGRFAAMGVPALRMKGVQVGCIGSSSPLWGPGATLASALAFWLLAAIWRRHRATGIVVGTALVILAVAGTNLRERIALCLGGFQCAYVCSGCNRPKRLPGCEQVSCSCPTAPNAFHDCTAEEILSATGVGWLK